MNSSRSSNPVYYYDDINRRAYFPCEMDETLSILYSMQYYSSSTEWSYLPLSILVIVVSGAYLQFKKNCMKIERERYYTDHFRQNWFDEQAKIDAAQGLSPIDETFRNQKFVYPNLSDEKEKRTTYAILPAEGQYDFYEDLLYVSLLKMTVLRFLFFVSLCICIVFHIHVFVVTHTTPLYLKSCAVVQSMRWIYPVPANDSQQWCHAFEEADQNVLWKLMSHPMTFLQKTILIDYILSTSSIYSKLAGMLVIIAEFLLLIQYYIALCFKTIPRTSALPGLAGKSCLLYSSKYVFMAFVVTMGLSVMSTGSYYLWYIRASSPCQPSNLDFPTL